MRNLRNTLRANFITTGFAMFAMFFGSGNLIFPLALGQRAGFLNTYAMLGLFITAIFMPFFTLAVMLAFDANYNKFFNTIGIIPGKLVAFLALALIGPFGVLPRCIAFSYSTFSIYFDTVSLFSYALISCLLIFILALKKSDVLSVIGNILTPILLVSLAIIIYRGFISEPIAADKTAFDSSINAFFEGLVEGYKTFDIFAALFFAAAIIPAFGKVLGEEYARCKASMLKLFLKASLIGMTLLFLVYGCLSLVSANLRGALKNVSSDKLLGIIANLTVGVNAGLLVNLVVSFACLTTAISLALVSAEFFRKEIFFSRISYQSSLLITMVISFFVSLLGFVGIMNMVLPILMIICPALIVLVLVNSIKYFIDFKYGYYFVYIAFTVSLCAHLLR